MSGILTSEQTGQLAILRALADPGAREQFTSNINVILEAQQNAEAALAKLREQEEINRGILDEAQRARGGLVEMQRAVESKERELEAREREIAAVQAALSAEKRAFEEVRAKVEKEHRDFDDHVDARNNSSKEWAVRLADHKRSLDDREADVAAREDRARRFCEAVEAAAHLLKPPQ